MSNVQFLQWQSIIPSQEALAAKTRHRRDEGTGITQLLRGREVRQVREARPQRHAADRDDQQRDERERRREDE